MRFVMLSNIVDTDLRYHKEGEIVREGCLKTSSILGICCPVHAVCIKERPQKPSVWKWFWPIFLNFLLVFSKISLAAQVSGDILHLCPQRTMMPSSPNSISTIFFYAIFQQLWNLLLFSEGSNAKVYPQTWGDTKLRLQYYCPCSNEHHHSCEKKNTWRSKTELLAIIQPNKPCRLSKVLSKPPCCIRSLQQTRARPLPNSHMINLLQWCWWNKWNLELLHPWGIETWNPSIHPNIT